MNNVMDNIREMIEPVFFGIENIVVETHNNGLRPSVRDIPSKVIWEGVGFVVGDTFHATNGNITRIF